jgi:hypothetical protein
MTTNTARKQDSMSRKTAVEYTKTIIVSVASHVTGAFLKATSGLGDTFSLSVNFSIGFAISAVIALIDIVLFSSAMGMAAFLLIPAYMLWNTLILGSYITLGRFVFDATIEMLRPVGTYLSNVWHRAKIVVGMSMIGAAAWIEDRMNTHKVTQTWKPEVVK